MKREYDFSNAKRGKDLVIPPLGDRILATLDEEVSALFGDGPLSDRLRSLAKRSRSSKRTRTICTVALTPAEYRRLRPLLERLGARIQLPPTPRRKAG